MRSHQWSLWIRIFLLFAIDLVSHGGLAAISSFQIERSPDYLTFLGSFAFSKHGQLVLNISQFHFYSPEFSSGLNLEDAGFFLVSHSNAIALELNQNNRNECILHDKAVHEVYNFSQFFDSSAKGNQSDVLVEKSAPGTGEFNLFFANCDKSRIVLGTVSATFFNTYSGRKSFCSAGTELLGTIKFIFSVAYFILFIFWMRHGLRVWYQSSSPSSLHILLSLVILSNSLICLFYGIRLSVVQASGLPHGWDLIFLIYLALHSILLLSILFIGLDRIEPYLSEIERGILYTSAPVILVSNFILNTTSGPILHSSWRLCIETINLVVSRLVIFAWVLILGLVFFMVLVWFFSSAKIFRAGNSSGMMHKDDRNLDNPFSKFYVLAVGFVIGTFLLVRFLKSMLPFSFIWIAGLLEEASIFAFFAYFLYRYRPRAEKSVYELFDEEDSIEEFESEL